MVVPKLSGVASKVNDAELEQLLFDLVRIPSVNPNVKADNEPAETQIIEFLEKKMSGYGFEVESKWLKVEGGDLIARISGDGPKTLVLNGHIDTVTGSNMSDALNPRIKHGKLYGRGASDTKDRIVAMNMLN